MRNVGTSARLPLSGNAALAAGALVQLALGTEFALAGLSKLLDPDFAIQLEQFVAGSPAAHSGILAPLLQDVVLPHASIAAIAAFPYGACMGLAIAIFRIVGSSSVFICSFFKSSLELFGTHRTIFPKA